MGGDAKSFKRNCFKRARSFINAGSLGDGSEVTGDLSVASANVGDIAIIVAPRPWSLS